MSSAQTWDPERYARCARFVTDLGMPVVHLLAPRPGERILDLGCGDGVLAAKLAEMGCKVIGVDASEMQVAAARKLGVDARVMAGEALQFRDEFDAVFSNAALHWMLRPEEVIAGVWHALRRGGRFVAEMGGHGNVEMIQAALVDALDRRGINGESFVPWFFPTIEDYSARLRKAGFVVSYISLFPRPTPLPGDVTSWLESFAEDFLSALPAAERPAYIEAVREALRPKLCDANGNWTADYVRLRFAAQKPRA
ncbi:MAG TPA: methyltransferase domain-containing protein [Rugosimonospora sp.]|jgi:trans-aconitate methyltransferase|nr:methyltransferase domain-containing protein [Rugosimonospora sp.]